MRALGARSNAIDGLRGVAVLAVLLDHLPFSTALTVSGAHGQAASPAFPNWLASILGLGHYGVNLFLVLSGFCIHMRWARSGHLSQGVDFLAFWKRRLHRLYPPYFVALIATLAGLFILHGMLGTQGSELYRRFGYASGGQFALDLLLALTLTQNLSGASQRIGNGPFWSSLSRSSFTSCTSPCSPFDDGGDGE